MLIAPAFSIFTTFLAIAAFGFVFLLGSAVFGDLFEHGDFAHDVDGHGGPSLLSSRILSVFVTAFGCFGAVGSHLGYGAGTSTAMGFGGGVLFAGLLFLFARFLFAQQASSHVEPRDLVGKTGQVIVTIPKGGVGQVRCSWGDTAIEKIARGREGEEIPANTIVKIEDIVGETVLVRRAE